MAHYLFNVVNEEAAELLQARMWGVEPDEPHRDALAASDLALIYLGAPKRKFVGRVELASAVRDWTPTEALAYPGVSRGGVLLAHVEEWDPPVPIDAVLSRLDQAASAKADFDVSVVRITEHEYETTLAVATGGALSAG